MDSYGIDGPQFLPSSLESLYMDCHDHSLDLEQLEGLPSLKRVWTKKCRIKNGQDLAARFPGVSFSFDNKGYIRDAAAQELGISFELMDRLPEYIEWRPSQDLYPEDQAAL
jgi:hypothetical protein